MLTTEVRIIITGAPAPKGSMKCVGARGKAKHALVDQLKTTKPWQEKVAAAVRADWPADQRADKHQPVGAEVTMTVARPAYHWRAGHGEIKPRYVDVHPVEQGHGDTDKHARTLLDALQAGGALDDDAQVVELTARKAFERPHDPTGDVLPCPGVVIRLYPL